jgi:hypothetical protein
MSGRAGTDLFDDPIFIVGREKAVAKAHDLRAGMAGAHPGRGLFGNSRGGSEKEDPPVLFAAERAATGGQIHAAYLGRDRLAQTARCPQDARAIGRDQIGRGHDTGKVAVCAGRHHHRGIGGDDMSRRGALPHKLINERERAVHVDTVHTHSMEANRVESWAGSGIAAAPQNVTCHAGLIIARPRPGVLGL